MGSSWPSHKAHPVGAKLNPKILISATNGDDISGLLISTRKCPLKGNHKVKDEVRRQILVRLATANITNSLRKHNLRCLWIPRRDEVDRLTTRSPKRISRISHARRRSRAGRDMIVRRQLADLERMCGFTTKLPLDSKTLTDI